MNITEELRLSCDATEKTKQEIVNYIWEWLNGLWTPDGKTIPTSTSYLRFWDTERSQYVDLSLLIDTDENPDAPLLAISQGVVVKKDFAAGGFLSSNQGALALGSGLNDFDDVPKLWLIHSELSARHNIEERADIPPTPVVGQAFVYTAPTQGNWVQNHLYRWTGTLWSDLGHKTEWDWTFDTLHLTKADGSTPAHLDLGNLTAHGSLKIGDDVTLYRSAPNILKTDDSFVVGEYASISSAGDAIFNSVKGTSYAGALKAGNEGTIAWDTPWLYITSHNKHMKLVTPANKVLELNSGGNLAFNVGGDFITVYGSKTFAPNGNNQGNVGGNGVAGAYWGSGWFNYLRYKNLSSFDALDDLAIVKQYKTKSIVEDDVEREVVDLETLSVVKADGADFVDSGNLGGFLLGCVKKLVLRIEKLEAELKN